MKKIIIGILCLALTSCGITGNINRTITTTTTGEGPDKKVVVVENCEASYSNNSLGTAEGRVVSGCDASGNSDNTNNTQMIAVPLSLIQEMSPR